jgi:hypothetical protein
MRKAQKQAEAAARKPEETEAAVGGDNISEAEENTK